MRRVIIAVLALAVAGCAGDSTATTVMSQQEQAADSNLCGNVFLLNSAEVNNPDLTPALAVLAQQWWAVATSPEANQDAESTPVKVPPGYTADIVKIENWCVANGFLKP